MLMSYDKICNLNNIKILINSIFMYEKSLFMRGLRFNEINKLILKYFNTKIKLIANLQGIDIIIEEIHYNDININYFTTFKFLQEIFHTDDYNEIFVYTYIIVDCKQFNYPQIYRYNISDEEFDEIIKIYNKSLNIDLYKCECMFNEINNYILCKYTKNDKLKSDFKIENDKINKIIDNINNENDKINSKYKLNTYDLRNDLNELTCINLKLSNQIKNINYELKVLFYIILILILIILISIF